MARPPSFQFYPKDYLADEAVSRMTLEQQGAYMWLLCYAWSMDKPGVLPNDDAVLAQLSTLGPRWSECREAIARAFKISDSEWIQERMRRERRAQIKRKSHRSEAGKLGANARWRKDINGQALDLPMAKNGFASSTASASAIALESTDQRVLGPNGPDGDVASASNGKRKAKDQTILLADGPMQLSEFFAEFFWPRYPLTGDPPKRRGRDVAEKQMRALFRGLDSAEAGALAHRIMDSLKAEKESWRDKEAQFIPRASTWLHQRRFEE